MSPEDPLAVHTATFAAWLATEKNYSPHTVSAYSSDLAAFFTFCLTAQAVKAITPYYDNTEFFRDLVIRHEGRTH